MNYVKSICCYFVKKFNASNRSVGVVSSRSVILKPAKIIHDYLNCLDVYTSFNNAASHLEEEGKVICSFDDNGDCQSIKFIENDENILYFHKVADKIMKIEVNKRVSDILEKYLNSNEVLQNFCTVQLMNISNNKSVKFFKDNNYNDFEDVLLGVKGVMDNEEEILIRKLSIQIYNNSKKLEIVKDKINYVLDQYGDYENIDKIFEFHNVYKTPTFVYIKGKCSITFLSGDVLNVECMKSGIGLNSKDLYLISNIVVRSNKIVTVENLTSYFSYTDIDSTIIYLGGFHSESKRMLLNMVYKFNAACEYYHYGDIDAGGLYILEHLRCKTKIPFIAYRMDIETLLEYKKCWVNLTINDRTRLSSIMDNNNEHMKLITFMLDNDCKLEQESINDDK